jgi:hypothetical protein
VIAERVDGNLAHLGILSTGVVSQNHSLYFVTQGLVERTLTSNSSTSRSLSTASRFKDFTSTF